MTDTGALRLPQAVQFGYGARSHITAAASRLGNRAFIVVDPSLAETPDFAAMAYRLAEAGMSIEIYTHVQPELPVESLTEAGEAARIFAPDLIIGYGGGSALDASKLVALLVSYGGPLSRYYGENAVPGPILPLIAVPTTAGTGSEVTPVAVISDPAQEMKVGISSPYLIPTVAVVDPELTLGAPAGVTAYSGIDALVHAVESYTAGVLPPDWSSTQPVFVGRNALTAGLSLDAIRHIGPSLPTAVLDGSDRNARGAMAYGSLLAGMAFGSTGTHLSHALQYPIGAITKTAHGLGTGLMLPYVLEACAGVLAGRLAEVGRALHLSGDESELAEGAIERIAEIGRDIGLPATLEEIGVSRGDLGRIAELALKSKRLVTIAPMNVDHSVLEKILEAAYVGDRTLARSAS